MSTVDSITINSITNSNEISKTKTTTSPTQEIPKYLLIIFDEIAIKEGFLDYQIEQDAGSKHGDGFMASMMRITIIGTRQIDGGANILSDKLSIICKLLPQSKKRQETFKSHKVFEHEVNFYNNILPILTKFQIDKQISNDTDGFLGYPHCYAARCDFEKNEYFIIMKDLCTEGYDLWNKFKSIKYENVKLLMEQLGRLHGLSMALQDQRPTEFLEIKKLTNIMSMVCKQPAMAALFKSSFEQAEKLLVKEDERQTIRWLKSEWITQIDELLNKEKIGRFGILGHGDAWNNNIMFMEKNNIAEKICLLDWQLCRFSSPVLDLVYFFMSSTEKSLRDEHFHHFIDIYYEHFSTIIKRCGSDPEKLMSFSDLQEQFKSYGRFGLIVTPILLQVLVSEPTNIVDLDSLMDSKATDNNNCCSSVTNGDEDIESTDIAVMDKKAEDKFRQRLSDAISDIKKYGWFDINDL